MIARTRVKWGAAWLDILRPGWHNLVNLDLLDMSDGRWCVAGQVFKEAAEGWGCPSGFIYLLMDYRPRILIRKGLMTRSAPDANYNKSLQRAWVGEIIKRREIVHR